MTIAIANYFKLDFPTTVLSPLFDALSDLEVLGEQGPSLAPLHSQNSIGKVTTRSDCRWSLEPDGVPPDWRSTTHARAVLAIWHLAEHHVVKDTTNVEHLFNALYVAEANPALEDLPSGLQYTEDAFDVLADALEVRGVVALATGLRRSLVWTNE